MTSTTELARFMNHVPAMVTMPNGNTPWAARYAAELRQVIIRQASRQPRSVQQFLGPSEIGAECSRQVVGKMTAAPRTNHVSDPWPSIIGTAVHAWLAEKFLRENELTGQVRWLTETKVAPHPLHPGTADLFDRLENALGDWKVLGPTSMAKVQSPDGPPRRYVVQMLLYALGFLHYGEEVRRVALIALPRTAASLDSMYVWEHELGPADGELLAEVFRVTEIRRGLAAEIMAGRLRLNDIPATPDNDACIWCFAGDTEVVTRDGIKPIRELAGTEPELLVPGILKTRGRFTCAPVREFGQQRLWKITLGSRRAEKVVYATAEHRWLLMPPPAKGPGTGHAGPRIYEDSCPERTTLELRPGDQLRSLRAATPARARLMPWAIAQGFVFGDGSRGQDGRPATLTFYDNGKDEALLPFFPFGEPVPYDRIDPNYGPTLIERINGLPRFWKDLPPIRESRAFLLSWLAGYFAADGNVTEGGQCTLDSADKQAILFARDIAAVCGIGYGPLRSKTRLGYGKLPSQLWSLHLRRRDLPSWFFLIKEHVIRATVANDSPARDTFWTIKSAEPTDRIETVYCATVPGAGMFGLADDLMTGNCPLYRPESARDGGYGCPGTAMARQP